MLTPAANELKFKEELSIASIVAGPRQRCQTSAFGTPCASLRAGTKAN